MKRYLHFILTLAVFVSLIGCSGNSRVLTEEEQAISDELKSKYKSADYLVFDGDTLMASSEVLSFYQTNDFQPIWIVDNKLNDKGEVLYDLIKNARHHGFMPEMFNYSLIRETKNTSILDAEMILSNGFLLYVSHMDAGCVDPTTGNYTWKKDSLDFDLIAELDKVREGSDPAEVILAHQPENWEYKQLQTGLVQFLDTYTLDTMTYDIPAFKEDSVKCYHAAHEALIGHGYLDASISDKDSNFIHELKKFQKLNGLLDDGIVGKWTGRALNESNNERFYHAAISMEKWRWKKKPYPAKYIRVNIPEFTLYFFDSTQLKSKHKVIVGAYDTQTPEFHASMERMITNPFWHVPYSIASTEILYGARKDSAYFSKRGYKVFKDGQQIDPTAVDWSGVGTNSFTYRVRQDGGAGNSLGKIKFLFPNVHSVFIHDTPTKRLFENDVRAYSHGCIRLHRPFDLAKSILSSEVNAMEADTLDSLVYRGTQRVIELKDPFEVYIEYFTVTGDSSGNVIFHPDIYGRDKKYIDNAYKKFYLPDDQTPDSEEDQQVAEDSPIRKD
ncbi:L,D-transpeptidase family protein [Paracrocinitomix mangrovi]|uniref:L,D-transpeptidase family protein n=1 Tax=Paracrocinitomix mangrovi TaxID=2862509 RepID=UPI001C8E4B75|nr:L,D-transpeptidase family protein [Paracrocinitomix mangrovi]UKN02968.1 L,D-transpeptidase family protein [Paracrocinitomix mangrovi]